MIKVQSLAPESRKDKYPLFGIIAVLALNYLSPFVSSLLPYLAMLICIIRVMRYNERVFATDYCILISVATLFQTPGRMSLLIYLCLFADVWYFVRRGVKAETAVVLMILLLNYLLLRMQMNINYFALCFGQLFLLRILLPLQDSQSAERCAKAFCLNMLISSAYALAFRNTWQLVDIRGKETLAYFGGNFVRFYGLFQDPNYYSLLLLTALSLMMKLKDSRAIGWPTFLIGSVMLIACGVLTYSKTFFLMLLFLVAVYLVWQFWNKKVFRGFMLTLCVLFVGSVLLFSDNSPFAVVLTRLFSSSDVGDLTTGRSEVFVKYFEAITDSVGSAFFGAGLAADNMGRDPHNLFIEMLYYVGVVGFVLMVVYYGSLIKAINFKMPKQNLIAKYVTLLVVLMVHMTLHGMALFPTYASFTLAAISMLIAPKKEGEPCPS